MKKAVAMLMVCLLALSGCKPATGGRHEARKHTAPKNPPPAQPNPAPDPNLRGSEIGSIQFTVWVELSDDKATVSWNAGFGLVNRVGHATGEHWDDTTKPGNTFSGSITHFHLGEDGRLWMQVVQNNNGRIVCTAENDKDRRAGAVCNGVFLV